MSRLFASGSQNIGALAWASVLPMNIQDWFPLGLTGLISLQSKGHSKSHLQHHNSKASILQHSAFFMIQFSHLYMTTGKTIALTIWIFVSKVTSLLFNTLSRFAVASLTRSKHLLISWLQLSSAIVENKICHCFHCFPICLPWSDGTRCHDLRFFNVEFQASFFTLLFHLHQQAL